jgi:hypothetical protein
MQIRLLRDTNNTHDDVISIRKRQNGDYLVRYVDGNVPGRVWVNSKNQIDLMAYIENILVFFQNDDDPFIIIQVSLPGTPIIYINQKEFNEEIAGRIMDSLEMCIENPPASFRE